MKLRRLFISLMLVPLLMSCNGAGESEHQSLAEITKQELATALNERDQLLALVKEISAGLTEIKRLENMMTVAAARPDDNPAQRARILADIAAIKERIQQRKAMINDLESSLNESTINNKELHETLDAFRTQIDSQMDVIESLRRQLTAANEHIGALSNTVDSLNTTVAAVAGERNAAQEASLRLENELNRCFYVVASKADLKEHGIIETGFLRKTRLMNGDFDKDFFTAADKRTLILLPLDASKAKVLSNHPESSYQLLDENGQKTIRITDPDGFWSLSNYLVVQKN